MEQHRVCILSKEEARSPLNLEDYYDIDRKMSKPGFKTADGKFNWHCSCVSSYVTGPCGYFFRKFLSNMERFMSATEDGPNEEARTSFEKYYNELTTCMGKYPKYYQPILEQYESSLQDILTEQTDS
ncbi:unnamed protein product [Dibothriocephalus latus]|uniref:Mitochondrial intermembrane space import and assembly protein 40 n=1 Tax=Dibothriocephalus latus TaxID=60516 RepID=A0A3P6V9M0_DIBLA|nr:unnamed protein product [Dibothriocephalus latus]